VTGVVPKANELPDARVVVNVTEPQLSLASGAIHVAMALHVESAESVMFEGQLVITGLVVSTTVTLNVQVDVFPVPSVAVYVTGVVPNANELPDARVAVNVGLPQLSDAIGAIQVPIALQVESALSVMFEGHPLITGLVVSTTVTLNEQVDTLPAASVAV
jgi:hypothetical protein